MGERIKKYGQVSPERAIVWTEKSPKYHYNHHHNHHHHHQRQQQRQPTRKVCVLYYLCQNRQLEHPHVMEVSLSSSSGNIYLRDVIERLNVLRGRGIGSMYSWSCKRSYKNGYVWYDLSDDDVIHPAHGNEYILKGSELFEESNSGRFSPALTFPIKQTQKALPEPPSSRNEESPSSSSSNGKTSKSSQGNELSPSYQRPCSCNGSLSLTEGKVYKNDGGVDASTQTEEKANVESKQTCTRGVQTDDCFSEHHQKQFSEVKQNQEICRDLVSPPSSKAGASSLSGRTDTLESLIRADVRKLNSFRILQQEGFRFPSSTKLKVTNMIMELISCGSISVKDHSVSLIPTYRPTFLDKECFSGSLAVKSMLKEDEPALNRSSSNNADRSSHNLDSVKDEEEGSSTSLKGISTSIKASLSKQPRRELLRSPLPEDRRISSERVESSRTIMSEASLSEAKQSNSSRNDKENVIQIEERLASGARVIIQSKVSPEGEGNS